MNSCWNIQAINSKNEIDNISGQTMDTTEILARVDDVIHRNRRLEWIYVSCTVVLCLIGIACCAAAAINGQYIWTLPSAAVSFFVYKPIDKILALRKSSIALATAPALITLLPTEKPRKKCKSC